MSRQLNAEDPASFNHKYTYLNSVRYHYVDEGPKDGPVVLACHGFPDLWFTWRHQIAFLVKKGYRVIAPDLLGYGQTDAPRAPEIVPIERYSMKSVAGDLVALLDQLGIDKVILLGHDWGGALVWRFALFHPERVTATISLCTPYFPPTANWVEPRDMVAKFPFWKYQLYFADPASEKQFDADPELFVRNIFRSSTLDGSAARANAGVDFLNLAETLENGRDVPRDEFISQTELDYYVENLTRRGFHGGLNWYKTRRANYDDDQALLGKTITTPCLMVPADKDMALPVALTAHMPQVLPQVKIVIVENSSHWITTEQPDAVNAAIAGFLDSL
ncbi:alpha/beta-hydrolase [Ramicandelaber brevisporus]|nr:alpha/beta-hydrolase [Ramicandelaber brevisporus]KAI8866218.1 alpha/beta-hydrolase [Ramicandelaber brevisporus]